MNRNRKVLITLSLVLIMAAMLTGCMGNDNRPIATPGITGAPINGTLPGNTMTPTDLIPGTPVATPAGDAGAIAPNGTNPVGGPVTNDTFDWSKNITQIVAEVDKISEIKSSAIVVNGDKAIVGVMFDPAYKGQLTDRIRNMITQKITSADPKVKSVAITSDPAQYQQIMQMADKLASGKTMNDLNTEFTTLYDTISKSMV